MSKPTTEFAEIIRIEKGKHDSPRDGNCAMELVAYMAHENHTDHPVCASEVIGNFVRSWNDALDDETRQRLAPYLVRIIGTRGTPEQEAQRQQIIWDWMLTVYVPTWLRAAGLHTEAEVVLRDGEKALDAARDAAWAIVRNTARAIAGEAGGEAAGVAAWAAAWDIAQDAAWVAAMDIAEAAAEEAAARDALRATVVELQESAFELLDKLIRVTEGQTSTVVADPERVVILREHGVLV